MQPFLPFWPLFAGAGLLGTGGFSLYPHAFTAPWGEVITAYGELFAMPELRAMGIMVRSPWGGGTAWVYGPAFFRVLNLRVGRGWEGMGVGVEVTQIRVEGEVPHYEARGWVSGELSFPHGVLFWGLGAGPREAQAHATLWISEGSLRMGLQGSWEGGFLGAVALVWRTHPALEVGWGYLFQRHGVGWVLRAFPQPDLGVTVSVKVHPELPVSTALLVGWRGLKFL